MSFRIKFNITESATEALIKFMKLVLTEIRGNEFKKFSNLIYLTKKFLIPNVINCIKIGSGEFLIE